MITAKQAAMAREAIGMSKAAVGAAVELNYQTISSVEGGNGCRTDTVARLKAFYEAHGVEFGAEGWVRFVGERND